MLGRQKELKRQLTFFGITVTRVSDGRMVEDWEIFDRLSIAEQAANNWLQRWIIGFIIKQFKKMQP